MDDTVTRTPLDQELLAKLGWTRRHVLAAVEGLDEEALRRSYVPSGWTPLSMIRHLTLDVERIWFAGAVAGDAGVARGLSGFHDPEPLSAAEIIAGYRAECDRSDKIISGLPAASPTRWQPYPDAPADLTAVILHVVVETACHAGHLDIVRENLDSRQFLVVDR
ncbi:hypothetical protein GCM10011575_20660 [Microlunatus endophyticus]|uniref:DinB superfamily protein n=1 Tax=Microlunatus endophyticus TaxID=1716077 RepID=A0A917S8X9_9ACTN|nr:DUF664 domain-containing protein [Microlunatus endophyticus]GGL62006.1 hypothetical protein GCM10011575_20660 [Microlunatus endophyticus]